MNCRKKGVFILHCCLLGFKNPKKGMKDERLQIEGFQKSQRLQIEGYVLIVFPQKRVSQTMIYQNNKKLKKSYVYISEVSTKKQS